MKRSMTISLFSALAASLAGCGIVPGTSMETIEPGYSGIKIDLYGGDKGIDNAQLVTGRIWYNGYTEQVISFPTFIKTYPFTSSIDEGNPKDESIAFSVGGTPVKANVGVSFSFPADERVKTFYKTYRKDPDAFLSSDLRNGLRDCFSSTAEKMRLTPPQIPSSQEKLMLAAQDCLQRRFPMVNVASLSLLSPIVLPENVQKAIDAQYASQQAATAAKFDAEKVKAQAAAELAKAQSQAAVTVAQAKAEAEANRLLGSSISPELIRLKQLEIEKIRAEKWSGNYATVVQSPNAQVGTAQTAQSGQ